MTETEYIDVIEVKDQELAELQKEKEYILDSIRKLENVDTSMEERYAIMEGLLEKKYLIPVKHSILWQKDREIKKREKIIAKLDKKIAKKDKPVTKSKESKSRR